MIKPVNLKFFAHGESYVYDPIEIHDGKKWGGKIMQLAEEPMEFQIEIPLDGLLTATHLRLTAKYCMEGPPNGHHCEDGGWQFVLGCPEGTTIERIE